MPEYMFWFSHHNSFFNLRFLELESLSALYGVTIAYLYPLNCPKPDASSPHPFCFVNLPNDDVARKIAKRSVLVRVVLEVWGMGETHDQTLEDIQIRWPSEKRRRWVSHSKSFMYKIFGYGKKYSNDERLRTMDKYRPLFCGDEVVNCELPDTVLWIIEHFGHPIQQNQLPTAVFYGREVASSAEGSDPENFVLKFEVTKRPVLGPTTLDCELGFLMSNLALVNEGSFVFDPFCGTGSLLLSAAYWNPALCLGSDIDVRVLRGLGVCYLNPKFSRTGMSKDVFQNHIHFNLPRPDVVVSDSAAPCWRMGLEDQGFFDCVIADPPYGLRAPTKRVGKRSEHEAVRERSTYCPQKIDYGRHEIMRDLLEFSAKVLVDSGRLVYLYPIELSELFSHSEIMQLPEAKILSGKKSKVGIPSEPRARRLVREEDGKVLVVASEGARDIQFLGNEYLERILPRHEDLSLEGAALQILAAGTGRIVVTMERRRRTTS